MYSCQHACMSTKPFVGIYNIIPSVKHFHVDSKVSWSMIIKIIMMLILGYCYVCGEGGSTTPLPCLEVNFMCFVIV